MKKRVLLTLLVSSLVGSLFASFPVNENTTEKTELTTVKRESNKASEKNDVSIKELVKAQHKIAKMDAKQKAEKTNEFGQDDWILLALWFFLGGIAAHRWYAGKPVGANILFIITLGGCGIWAIIDLIKIVQQKFM